jgi:cytochrome c peroxidase
MLIFVKQILSQGMIYMRYILICLMSTGMLAGCLSTGNRLPEPQQAPVALKQIEALGRNIFFDATLSSPPGQSCATCHDPQAGWTGPKSEINAEGSVYPGANIKLFGNRKPPTVAYATFSPVFHLDPHEKIFFGGNFWDGRATGWLLGQPAAEQAQGPFLNPVEQNLGNPQAVVDKVCSASYSDQLRSVFGNDICNRLVDAYNAIGQALFAYENSPEVNSFNSKYDYYLSNPSKYPLTPREILGLELFNDEKRGMCAECHPSTPTEDGTPPVFTDFSYDNLGLPANPDNPTYLMPIEINPDGATWKDEGLGGFLGNVPALAHHAEATRGAHKVPTLRNVDKRPTPDFVKAYGHNGVFKSLKEIVHFYNTRDVHPACENVTSPEFAVNCWPKPEIPVNVNIEELGNLKLSEDEEWAIVAFLKTLNDGWVPPEGR